MAKVRLAPSIHVHFPQPDVATSSDHGGDMFGQRKVTSRGSDRQPHQEEQVATDSGSNNEEDKEDEESDPESTSENNAISSWSSSSS